MEIAKAFPIGKSDQNSLLVPFDTIERVVYALENSFEWADYELCRNYLSTWSKEPGFRF